MTSRRSASMHSSMWCVMRTTVTPVAARRSAIVRSTSCRPEGSSMAVGSSITRISGCMASTPAMATRCFCPPERRCGALLRNSYIPTRFNTSSTRRRISAGETPRFSGANATSSSTTLATIWLSGFWNTMPTVRRTLRRFSSLRVSMPLTVTVPSVGTRMAFRSFASVDLPEPLCPSTAMNDPASIERLTPESASRPASG